MLHTVLTINATALMLHCYIWEQNYACENLWTPWNVVHHSRVHAVLVPMGIKRNPFTARVNKVFNKTISLLG